MAMGRLAGPAQVFGMQARGLMAHGAPQPAGAYAPGAAEGAPQATGTGGVGIGNEGAAGGARTMGDEAAGSAIATRCVLQIVRTAPEASRMGVHTCFITNAVPGAAGSGLAAGAAAAPAAIERMATTASAAAYLVQEG